ncbi:MAG: MaoC/PaaZ C-terminal domain-containing protein [Christensenellaceae bacterium]
MCFDDFKIGDTYKLKPVVITEEQISSFAKQYDPLPHHMDEAFASQTKFGGIIAPGVMSFMAVWAEFVKLSVWTDHLVAGKSTKIEWLSPVYAGDTLSGEVEVTGLEKNNPHTGTVTITVHIYNQDRVYVIRDITEAVVRTRRK